MTAEAGADPTRTDPADVGTDDVIAMLRAKGGRATAARRATIEVLLSRGAHRHLSADDVALEVRRNLPDVAESSIYRTLTVLEGLGLVTHVHLDHGPSTYHLADDTHRHLVCQNCHATIEIPTDEFDDLARHLRDEYGFTMRHEHFAIVGLCRECGHD